MCGIVGYVGRRPVHELLLDGLTKLEYRGYDSAGISVIAAERIEAVRAVGNLSALRAKLEREAAAAPAGAVALAERPPTTGIGHTRWATHGRVSEENAHPHCDSADRIHVAVNGIGDTYLALQRALRVENGEIVILRPEAVTITTGAGEPVERPEHVVDWDAETAEKGGYETFMLKEIYEQADAVAEAIADRTARGEGVELEEQDA